MESIKDQIERLEAEIKEEPKWRLDYIKELKAQIKCDHDWKYKPMEPGDSSCFWPEVPERYICSKCKREVRNEDDQVAAFKEIRRTLGC